MDARTAERRGEEARQLLETPLLKEAWQALRDVIVARLESESLTDDQRRDLNYQLQALRKHKRWFEQVLVTGTLTAMEEQRKRTIADRILRRA